MSTGARKGAAGKVTPISSRPQPAGLAKAPTGIAGLDQVMYGGLPKGRPTLVCGGPGTGKTLLAMEFLVKGVTDYGEPGVFMSFEESGKDLSQNVASLGFDVDRLVAEKKMVVDQVRIERSEIEETGEYDLQGLFIRLGLAIDSIGAKRVALDTIEVLFSTLTNEGILRAELRRLFRWLKEKGVTAVITGERGEGTLTRYGLEEYVSDCVILLDQRVNEGKATRRLRIVKYRGSPHGTNEYPFLLDEKGFTVQPITGILLDYRVPSEQVTTGIPKLDDMLAGKGYYRGSTILVTGGSGTGKTSMAAYFVDATCRRGERCLYFASEESSHQLIRNMGSIGLDLQHWIDQGLLQIHASRPVVFGLEAYLTLIRRQVEEFRPLAVVFDPISGFEVAGTYSEVQSMLMLLVDYLKGHQVTTLFTSLTPGQAGSPQETSEVGISSLLDTWILLRNLEQGGERTRGLYVLKSRGMAHSNQIREFRLTKHGVDLVDVYIGPQGILTGLARETQEAQDRAVAELRQRELERGRLLTERRRKALEARIAELQAEFQAEESDTAVAIDEAKAAAEASLSARIAAAKEREEISTLPKQGKGARK
ncbi:MAG: circadian clock kinase KaiC [Rhodocyclaceae bacterium]|nr:circadian clock kinase KaiC [Rhodocyclaceae bacterium]